MNDDLRPVCPRSVGNLIVDVAIALNRENFQDLSTNETIDALIDSRLRSFLAPKLKPKATPDLSDEEWALIEPAAADFATVYTSRLYGFENGATVILYVLGELVSGLTYRRVRFPLCT